MSSKKRKVWIGTSDNGTLEVVVLIPSTEFALPICVNMRNMLKDG